MWEIQTSYTNRKVVPNSVLRKAPIIRRGIVPKQQVLPLPPYSPDYTIEKMFSKVKQWLRRAEARAKAELYDTLGEGMRRVTAEDILGWFRHAGLCATHG